MDDIPRLALPGPGAQAGAAQDRDARAVLNIRQSILLAFALMCAFTTAVGTYSSFVIRQSAALVASNFDRSLVAVDFARAAEADFTELQNGLLRQMLAAGTGGLDSESGEAEALTTRAALQSARFYEHLELSQARAAGQAGHAAAEAARRAAHAWEDAVRLAPRPISASDLLRLDTQGAAVRHAVDELIAVMIGDGLAFRQQALRVIRLKTDIDVAATLGGLLLSGGVAWYLHRRIAGPIGQASATAVRIAAGELDVAIPAGRRDELGRLLAAMAQMRDSIQVMMQSEIGQRRSAQARLMDAVETMQEGVVLVDAAGQIVLTNAMVEIFLGKPQTEGATIRSIADLLRHLTRARLTEESRHAVGALVWPLEDSEPGTTELSLTDGMFLRVSWCGTREGGMIAFFSDITEPRRREAQLATTNLWFDAALSQMSQGLCVYDKAGKLQIFNARFCDIHRLRPSQLRPGMALDEVRGLLRQSCPEQPGQDARPWAAIGSSETFTQTRLLADGRVIELSHRPVSDGGFVLSTEDITARTRSDARIAYLAGHDSLTRLPNRSLFTERLAAAIDRLHLPEGAPPEPFALILIDLDRFKEVNDTRGHPVGDRLLRVVGERLASCARQRDTVARLGGDEFAIIQHDLATSDDARELAERIVAAIGSPFVIDGARLEIGASLGVALAPEHGTTPESLLRAADTALYRAKEDGRSNARFFTPSMELELQSRRSLEHDLQAADLDAEMELLYQPIVDIQAVTEQPPGHPCGRIIGFEALLRWHHPTNGLMMPGAFIAASEDTGFIERLGAWILARACADAAVWPAGLKVAVNISPLQFGSGRLAPCVREALAASGLPAGRLEVEITENTLLREGQSTLTTLRAISGLGVKIVLDDFGTGTSSLSYLRSFPFDRIKIDRSFVADLGLREDAAAIITAIVGLGRSLGIPVTAEGVETITQLGKLRAEGCSLAQGYLFSHPVETTRVASLELPAMLSAATEP
jgi:diguanylate cyclase (GGDEF)-like protein